MTPPTILCPTCGCSAPCCNDECAPAPWTSCTRCHGFGVREWRDEYGEVDEICDDCAGTGRADDDAPVEAPEVAA